VARHRQTKEILFFFQFQSNCQVRDAELCVFYLSCISVRCAQLGSEFGMLLGVVYVVVIEYLCTIGIVQCLEYIT